MYFEGTETLNLKLSVGPIRQLPLVPCSQVLALEELPPLPKREKRTWHLPVAGVERVKWD